MNISISTPSNTNAIIACDVSKETINIVFKLAKNTAEREIINHTIVLEKQLKKIKALAHL